ncbi:MAG: Wzz/FepE/Etk N-terminal domain-containing protein, partial [Candidatus Acidiferrum sp.]
MSSHEPNDGRPMPLSEASSRVRLVPIGSDGFARLEGEGQSGEESSSAFDLSNLSRSFARRWFLATATGLLLTVAAVLVAWFAWPMKYTTASIVHVSLARPSILTAPEGNNSEFAAYQKTQQNLAKSQT